MAESKIRWQLVAIAVLLLVLIGGLVFRFRPGIQVTIQNTGSTAMRSVVLHVTGAAYEIGDIPPGASATARMNPGGESGLDVQFTAADGKVQRLVAGGYFESGYRGSIHVSIKDGAIVQNQQNIKSW